MKKHLLFKQFLKSPGKIGALYPSSEALCRKMVSDINLESAHCVIELGPGTGVITQEILITVNPHTKFFAVELDRKIYNEFKRYWPDVTIINDSAENLTQIMDNVGMGSADAIISGLPWASFSNTLQKSILCEVVDSLASGGYFTTFAYVQGMVLPAARRFRNLLSEHFRTVETTSVVWNNIPPAFVYRCRK
jgi:phospholipid N-methyltransferase